MGDGRRLVDLGVEAITLAPGPSLDLCPDCARGKLCPLASYFLVPIRARGLRPVTSDVARGTPTFCSLPVGGNGGFIACRYGCTGLYGANRWRCVAKGDHQNGNPSEGGRPEIGACLVCGHSSTHVRVGHGRLASTIPPFHPVFYHTSPLLHPLHRLCDL